MVLTTVQRFAHCIFLFFELLALFLLSALTHRFFSQCALLFCSSYTKHTIRINRLNWHSSRDVTAIKRLALKRRGAASGGLSRVESIQLKGSN